MSIIQKTIDGYNCEFCEELNMTDVQIEKGSFCSSLEFAHQHGGIMNYDTGNTARMNPRTIAKIQAWADSLGY
jgi:hypothetical protein